MTKRLRIPDELADRIDGVRGDVPRDRWAARALEWCVGAGPLPPQQEVKPAPVRPVRPITPRPKGAR